MSHGKQSLYTTRCVMHAILCTQLLKGGLHFQINKQDKLDDISDVCVMSDMIRFEDMDKDGRLGLNEFYAAFSKLYSE